MTSHPRAELQALVNAINLAVTLTVRWLFPEVPEQVLLTWVAIIAAVARFAESAYDARHAT